MEVNENIDDATTDRLVDSIKMILTVDEEITFEDSNGYMWLKLNEMTEDGKYQYVYTVNDSVTGSIKLSYIVNDDFFTVDDELNIRSRLIYSRIIDDSITCFISQF